MSDKPDQEREDKRPTDDLDLPEETAEDVKGGSNLGTKHLSNKIK